MIAENKENRDDSNLNEQPQQPKQAWKTYIEFGLHVVLVVATVALAIYTYKLWRATYDLSVETRKTSEQQAKDTQDALTQTKEAIKATNRLADIAADANKIATNAVVASNRPWVGMAKLQIDGEIKMLIRNSGKSPALDVRVSSFTVIAATESAGRRDLKKSNEGTLSDLFPDTEMMHTIIPKDGKEMLFNNIISTEQTLWVNGRIDYNDSFGKMHTTIICLYYDVTLRDFAFCSKGNSAS